MVVTAGILAMPLGAMQFTPEGAWRAADFAFAGILLFGTGLGYALLTWPATTTAYRLAAGAALATGLLLVWSNLPVCLISSEHTPALWQRARGRNRGLCGAFPAAGNGACTAGHGGGPVLVPVAARLIWPQQNMQMLEAAGLTAFFLALWLGATLLFWRAGAGWAR